MAGAKSATCRGENRGASERRCMRQILALARSAARCRDPAAGPEAGGRPCGSWRRCRERSAGPRRDHERRRAGPESERPSETGRSKSASDQISIGLRRRAKMIESDAARLARPSRKRGDKGPGGFGSDRHGETSLNLRGALDSHSTGRSVRDRSGRQEFPPRAQRALKTPCAGASPPRACRHRGSRVRRRPARRERAASP